MAHNFTDKRKEYLKELGHEDVSVEDLAKFFEASPLTIIMCQEFYGWFAFNWDMRDKGEYRMNRHLVQDMETRLSGQLKAAVLASLPDKGATTPNGGHT